MNGLPVLHLHMLPSRLRVVRDSISVSESYTYVVNDWHDEYSGMYVILKSTMRLTLAASRFRSLSHSACGNFSCKLPSCARRDNHSRQLTKGRTVHEHYAELFSFQTNLVFHMKELLKKLSWASGEAKFQLSTVNQSFFSRNSRIIV